VTINRMNASIFPSPGLPPALLLSQRAHAKPQHGRPVGFSFNLGGSSSIADTSSVEPRPASIWWMQAGCWRLSQRRIGEGFGNWLEFGFTRNNHTDGGDPTISPLFNFSGMNIFNVKAKLLAANYHTANICRQSLWEECSAQTIVRGESVAHKNATNGDVYVVATKLIVLGNKFAFLATAGSRNECTKVWLWR